MKKRIGLFLGLLTVFLLQTPAFATMVSDVSNGYEKAWHKTAKWQMLGDSQHLNDGVSWSVGGGAYGHEDVTVGDLVTFKFDFWHQGWGKHKYDQLKVWLDTDSSDGLTDSWVFFAEQHWKSTSGGINPINGGSTVWTYNPKGAKRTAAEENAYFSYTYEDLLITTDMVGELFLRARVHCNHVRWRTGLPPAGYLSQGEVEDYFITVNPVPEPATLILFGFGLLGLTGVSRRKK